MDFDRLFNRAKVAGNLFVQFAGDDVVEHFALTRCEGDQARADFGKFGLFLPNGAILLNCRSDGCEQDRL
jgi:hypothetical protein